MISTELEVSQTSCSDNDLSSPRNASHCSDIGSSSVSIYLCDIETELEKILALQRDGDESKLMLDFVDSMDIEISFSEDCSMLDVQLNVSECHSVGTSILVIDDDDPIVVSTLSSGHAVQDFATPCRVKQESSRLSAVDWSESLVFSSTRTDVLLSPIAIFNPGITGDLLISPNMNKRNSIPHDKHFSPCTNLAIEETISELFLEHDDNEVWVNECF